MAVEARSLALATAAPNQSPMVWLRSLVGLVQIRTELFLYTRPAIRNSAAGWAVYAAVFGGTLPLLLAYLAAEQALLLARWPLGLRRGVVFRMVTQFFSVPWRFLRRRLALSSNGPAPAVAPAPARPGGAVPAKGAPAAGEATAAGSRQACDLRVACAAPVMPDGDRARQRGEALPLPGDGPAQGRGRLLTCVTYNIQSGMGLDGRVDLARTSQTLHRLRPDVVALQEVEVQGTRAAGGAGGHPGYVDQAAEIGSRLGMEHSTFLATRPLHFGQPGEYGVAVVSRFPIVDTREVHFTPWAGRSRRGLLLAKLQVAPEEHVWFGSMHLQNDVTGAEQRQQFHEAFSFVEREVPGHSPVLVGADCNLLLPLGLPGCHVQDVLASLGVRCVTAEGYDADHLHTYPSHSPLGQADTLFIGRPHLADVHHAAVPDDPETAHASDHLPLLARVRLTCG